MLLRMEKWIRMRPATHPSARICSSFLRSFLLKAAYRDAKPANRVE